VTQIDQIHDEMEPCTTLRGVFSFASVTVRQGNQEVIDTADEQDEQNLIAKQ
jgi:hypothetical protein